MEIKFKKLFPSAKQPRRAYDTDAGFDLFSVEDCIVNKNGITVIPTGIAVEIPPGYEMQIRPRSGLAALYGFVVVNSPGTIDSGYRGEIKVIACLVGSNESLHVHKGEGIAQAVIYKLPDVSFVEVETLSDSARGTKGMGSTG
ncbi:MAG: dUTP diphosphatase [Nitrospirae bacterium]|nr:dUTP diphosphatase [Nitrospirota bacterium]